MLVLIMLEWLVLLDNKQTSFAIQGIVCLTFENEIKINPTI